MNLFDLYEIHKFINIHSILVQLLFDLFKLSRTFHPHCFCPVGMVYY